MILTVNEAKSLGRPIGKVADEKIIAFITEVEHTIIRRSLGDDLYLRILAMDEFDDTFTTLLDGGVYTTRCGHKKVLTGLKTAEAYYVYAQNVRAGDFESTRYGMMVKDGQYSTHVSSKERDSAANSATEVANAYLEECIEYCKEKDLIADVGESIHLTSGCIIKKVMV